MHAQILKLTVIMLLFITQLDVASDAFEEHYRPDLIAKHNQPDVNQCKS